MKQNWGLFRLLLQDYLLLRTKKTKPEKITFAIMFGLELFGE